MLGMLSQSMLNLIDAALVGHLGEVALAGVGVGGYAMFMLSAVVFGLSSSVQAQTAHRVGASHGCLTQPLQSGLVIGLAVALPLSLWAWWQAPLLVGLINQADAVQDVAVNYFRWRVLSLVAIALTLCFRGYWNGRQQTYFYLRIIVAVHLLNVVTSAGLIYGLAGLPEMGPSGAGVGTTLSLFVGLLVWGCVSLNRASMQHFLTRLPGFASLRTTLTLSAPHSIQQLLFAAGYAVLFWLLSQLGTASVAVGHVLINLSLLLILPGVGVGVAVMSLVGEALGRDAQQEAHRWGLDALRVAWLLLLILALPMLIAPEHVLGIFFSSRDLIALGTLPAANRGDDCARCCGLSACPSVNGRGGSTHGDAADPGNAVAAFSALGVVGRGWVGARFTWYLVDAAFLPLDQFTRIFMGMAAPSLAGPGFLASHLSGGIF